MTERQAPWTVQLPLVVVFLGGIAAIALGVRTKGADVAFQGLVQMLLGALMCVVATSVKNGSRDARSILVITLAGGAALSVLVTTISSATRFGAFALAAVVIAMLTLAPPSRRWFGDVEVGEQPEIEDSFGE